MAAHNLKSWLSFFGAHLRDEMPFEYRRNDREFKDGDILHLEEYNPITGTKTGRTMDLIVYHVWDSSDMPGLPAKYVIMTVGRLPPKSIEHPVTGTAETSERLAFAGGIRGTA